VRRIDEWLLNPPRTKLGKSLMNGLAAASRVYTAGVRARSWAYRSGMFRKTTLNTPVISIGNITVGGTGKTPLAQFVARHFLDTGRKPVIVSRGYRKEGATLAVVSDGKRLLLSPRRSGDEPYLLARTLPGVPVIVSPNRALAGFVAVSRFAPDVVIMDDAFQHMKLARNLDIVLVDAVNPFGNEKTLPGGTLREPPPNLARADVIVVSRSDQTDRLSELRERLRSLNPSAPVVLGVHAPDGLLVHPTGDSLDLTILKNARVLAVSSIGNPWSFAESVRTLGAEVLDHLRFPNHAKYRHRALSRIADAARQLCCEAIITTEKDAVRLPSHIDCGCPIWVLSIRFRIVEGAASFLDLLDALVTRAKTMDMNGQA